MSFEALATIAEAAPVLLVVLDANGHCDWCNRAWSDLTGRSAHDARGAGWFDAVHPDDRTALRDASREQRAFETEVRIQRPDGRYRWCLARTAPRVDERNRFVGHVVSATDVTGWRAAHGLEPTGDAAFGRPYHDPISVRLPARPNQLAVVRRLVTAWLDASGATPEDVAAVVLAVSEATSNAIEHAYERAEGWFELEAAVDGNVLTVVVRDGGRWRPKPAGAGGRGLGLMARVMDEFETRRSESGTEVWMRRALAGAPA